MCVTYYERNGSSLIFETNMKYIFSLLFLTISLSSLKSQQMLIDLSGKIVTGSSTPVYNVSVVDVQTIKGTVSDVYGNFQLKVNAGDTVRFTSIGYKTVKYQIPDTVSGESFRILVSMVADTFLLREALVVPWPQNITMLKEAMLNQRKEKETISPYAGFREIEGDPVEPEHKLFSNPLSFLYSKLNKKARQEKKMEKYRQILQEKEIYSPEQIY